MNRLYYGDSLDVLRDHIADASGEALDDTWNWGPTTEGALLDVIGSANTALVAPGACHARSL